MSQPRFTDEQLIAFASGQLPADQHADVAQYIEADANARSLVNLYRSVQHVIVTDDSVEPTRSAIARARAAFNPHAALQPNSWLEAVDRFIAKLVYDSRLAPAMVRSDQSPERIDMTFQIDSGDVDLQAERRGDADNDSNRRSWHIMGQISDQQSATSEADRPEVALVHSTSIDAVRETRADERGVFQMNAPAGAYDLLIHRHGRLIVLPAIHLP